MQTTIDLPDNLRRRLEMMSIEEGVDLDEIVRSALENLLTEREQAADDVTSEAESNALRSGFGLWTDRRQSTEASVKELCRTISGDIARYWTRRLSLTS